MKWITGGSAAVVLAIIGYVSYAAATSHATNLWDGVLYWPSYHQRQQLVLATLYDPDSAEFRNLYFRKADGYLYVCGELNAKNRMGGYVGFTRFYASKYSVNVVNDDSNGSTTSAEWEHVCIYGQED